MNFSGLQLANGGGTVIYHKDNIIGINKNPGSVVQPTGEKRGLSIIEQVRKSISSDARLVHRLDCDTSGAMIIALTYKTAVQVSQAIQNRDGVSKKYRCIVSGKISKEEGVIEYPIFVPKDGAKCRVSETGKVSETHYKVIEQKGFIIDGIRMLLSYLEVEIKTGRRHQIRIHCAESGFPIVGDRVYGRSERNHILQKCLGVERQALHACEYTLSSKVLGKNHTIKAKILPDMKRVISQICE